MVKAMRRSWITGARPYIDARRSAMAVQPATASSTSSPGCDAQLGPQAGGEGERVPLVRALVAESGTGRLATADVGRSVGDPRARHVVGRLVSARVVDGRDRRELRSSHGRPMLPPSPGVYADACRRP